MKTKNPVMRLLYEYGVITLGCALYALGFSGIEAEIAALDILEALAVKQFRRHGFDRFRHQPLPVMRLLYEYGVITLGCALYALGFNWFFQPNNISGSGRVTRWVKPSFSWSLAEAVLKLK